MADAGVTVDAVRVDGGMAASDRTMQFLADILPASVERPVSIETAAWGAAYVAGLTRGLYPDPGDDGRAVGTGAPLCPTDAGSRARRALRWVAPRRRWGVGSSTRSRPVNLLSPLPHAEGVERVDTLLTRPGLRIERIVSRGRRARPGSGTTRGKPNG
jgi:hypothetical protein